MKKEITKNLTIGEVLKIDESLGDVLMGFGMHCLFCPMSQMETLEEASAVHDIDIDLLVKKLNEAKNFKIEGKLKSNKKLVRNTKKA